MSGRLDWKPNANLSAGKGATVQEFVAIAGSDRLEIDVAPWGEGRLRVNGREVARERGSRATDRDRSPRCAVDVLGGVRMRDRRYEHDGAETAEEQDGPIRQ